MPRLTVPSPVGPLVIEEDSGAIVEISWNARPDDTRTPLLAEAARQLDAYFAGRLRQFDLPLAPRGTAFQQRVWRALAEIPYGETRTYGGLATRAGGAARAIGGACGANPIPVVLPCHRVVAANGGAGGYSGKGGLRTKGFLLDLEAGAARLL